jgi:hypothetical protein
MTQILTCVSEQYILQVTDRLVTSVAGKPFDELANKNLVYYARNAVVTVAYTGISYIGGKPTDHWIAEKLTDNEFQMPSGRPGLSGIRFGMAIGGQCLSPWLDLGLSLIHLRDALSEAVDDVRREWQRDWLRMPFEVIVAGYQWKKSGRVRPIIAQIQKTSSSGEFELRYEERDRHFGGNGALAYNPSGNLDIQEMSEVLKKIAKSSTDKAESILVDVIRDLSRDHPAIGPHCMSILIAPPSLERVRIRLRPDTEHSLCITSGGENSRKLCAYSPWVIGPKSVSGPAVISGTFEFPLGPYNVSIEAPSNDGSILGFHFSQRRNIP